MTALSADKPEKLPPPVRRRIIRVGLVLGIILVVFGTAAAITAYRYKTRLLNHYLDTAVAPYKASVEKLSFRGFTGIRLRGLQVSTPDGRNPLVSIENISAKAGIADILAGQIPSLTLENPSVTLDDVFFESLTDEKNAPPVAATTTAGVTPLLWLGEITVRTGSLKITRSGQPTLELQFGYSGEELTLNSDNTVIGGSQELLISPVTLTSPQGTTLSEIPYLKTAFTPRADGIDISSLEVTSPKLALTPEVEALLAPLLFPPPGGAVPETTAENAGQNVRIRSLSLTGAQISATGLATDRGDGHLRLPEISAELDYTGSGIQLEEGVISTDEQRVKLTSLSIAGQVSIPGLEATFSMDPGRFILHTLQSPAPKIHITPALLESFAPPTPGAAGRKDSGREKMAWTVEQLSISNADLFYRPLAGSLPVSGSATLSLTDLTHDGTRLRSPATQRLDIRELSLSDPSITSEPLLQIGSGTLALVPDALLDGALIETLHLSGVSVNLPQATVASMTAPPEETPVTAATPAEAAPFWQGLSVRDLRIEDGSATVTAFLEAGIPGITTHFGITTETGDGGRPFYQFTTLGLAAAIPQLGAPAPPFATVQETTVTLSPENLWKHEIIDRVEISGIQLAAGDALLSLSGDGTETPPETPPPPAGDENKWQIRELVIRDSSVTLKDIIPGLPPVPFAIDTKLKNIPLSTTALAKSEQIQEVEIADASVRSVEDSLTEVIHLDSIFLRFSLAGLLRQEIESVTIVSPTLYVGEHLFWYIRLFESGEPATGTGGEEGGWDIGSIEAKTGSLVLAPKGDPIPGVPAIPFSGKTRLIDGQLSFAVEEGALGELQQSQPLVSLSIPPGNYPLKAFNLDLNLDLIGLEGDIQFNLPLGQGTNNLVQTLTAEELRFEQLSASEVFLSVTYDEEGIYAQFGGETYDGYANGAVNFYYARDSSPWDAWVTGSGFELGELTNTVTPLYLRMSGKADCELVAGGDLESLDNLTTRGHFTTRGDGGEIDIVALGDLAADFQEGVDIIAEKFIEVGIATIQNFTYDTAAVTVSTLGREGTFSLDLRGPSGVRKIEVIAHDHRYRQPALAQDNSL